MIPNLPSLRKDDPLNPTRRSVSRTRISKRLAGSLRFIRRVLKLRAANGSSADREVSQGIAQEELTGLGYIFWGRFVALAILAVWALTLPFERSAAYLLALGAFAVLGAMPYLLARRGFGTTPTLAAFVLLDVGILTYILVVPPPFYVDGWTPQINLRLPNFLFLAIYLVSMALSYSPGLVLWAGAVSAAAWSVGFLWVASLPGSVLSSSRDTLDTGMSSEAVISRYLHPSTVSLTNWYNQLAFLVLATLILTVTVWRSRQLVHRQVAAESARANLSRYFSPNIVRELSTNSQGFERSVTQPAAVLFADMVGFTAISEHFAPEKLIGLLRDFHGRLAQVAFANGGTVDKYIGDSIMVHFGTPHPKDNDPVRALTCAAAMIDELNKWNAERASRGEIPIRIGIGVHYGNVVVGNIGHARRLEYAVLGDTVNVASRLERLTRHAGARVMVSDALVQAVQSQGIDPTTIIKGLRRDKTRHVRGRHHPISVWSEMANINGNEQSAYASVEQLQDVDSSSP